MSRHSTSSKNKWDIKITLVQGSDPDLDEMSKHLFNSSHDTLSPNEICSEGEQSNIDSNSKDLKDDVSCIQSEYLNDSTFDRLKTPLQSVFKSPLLEPGCEDLPNFFFNWDQEYIRFKASDSEYLKNDIWSRVLLLTKNKQLEVRKEQSHLFRQKSEPNLNLEWPLASAIELKPSDPEQIVLTGSKCNRTKLSGKSISLCKPAVEVNMIQFMDKWTSKSTFRKHKPIFSITRVRKGGAKRRKQCRFNSFATSTGSKHCSLDVGCTTELKSQNEQNEAVLLIQ